MTLCLTARALWGKLSASSSHTLAETKKKAKRERDEVKIESKNPQAKGKEQEFWRQTHLYENHGSCVGCNKSRDFSERQFPHLQNEMVAMPKDFPKKRADECTEMRDGGVGGGEGKGSLCTHSCIPACTLTSVGHWVSASPGAVPLQLIFPEPPPLFIKTSSQGSININGIVNTCLVSTAAVTFRTQSILGHAEAQGGQEVDLSRVPGSLCATAYPAPPLPGVIG